MREVKLPSGAVLKVNAAPFAEAKQLAQAVFAEAKGVSLVSKAEIPSVVKDLFALGFSSLRVEAALKPCLARCIYSTMKGELKIDDDTFEPLESRADYVDVCFSVLEENVGPFAKSLYAKFVQAQALMNALSQT